MSIDTAFRPRSLTASEYVRELFEPTDNAAILVRNRGTGKTVQRITKAETIASPEFQAWLAARSAAGSDVYVGMNPIKDGAYSRTKENIKNIRHVYLDLDKNGDEVSRSDSKFNRSPAAKLRSRHVARQASGRLESEWIQSG